MRTYTSSGYRDENSTYHYGVTIRHDTPTTGVISNNAIEWLHEETADGIDLSWENRLSDFEQEHGREPTDEERDDAWMGFDWGSSTYLIGSWTKSADGVYDPDKSGDFSAIVGEIYTQVVWSKTVTRAALCSPCFPGQADIGSKGEYLAYTLPADVMGEE